jgi:hypothetical protein
LPVPPELLPEPPLEPELDPELEPDPDPDPDPDPVPLGHVVPPGSHPVPQLTVWQW